MAGSINKVIIVGNLGQDPEIRSFSNGGKIANLRIATSESWTDKASGERKERTEWHTIAIHSEPLIKVAEQYLRKGSKVYVEGQLETRKWQDQSGADRYSTEVALRPFRSELQMLDSKGSDDRQQSNGSRGGDGRARQPQGGAPAGGAQRPQRGADFDDSIPFAPCVLI